MPGERTATSQSSSIPWSFSYFKTWTAILKIIQVVSNLLCFICVYELDRLGCTDCLMWFIKTVTLTGFCLSIILLFLYILRFYQKINNLPWLRLDIVICIIWVILNLAAVGKIITLYALTTNAAILTHASSFFGFFATIAYGCDGVMNIWRILRGQPA